MISIFLLIKKKHFYENYTYKKKSYSLKPYYSLDLEMVIGGPFPINIISPDFNINLG